MPTTAKSTATLCPGRGVKINHVYYWSDVFRDPEFEGQHLPVRYDPFDAGTAYAFCRNQWVECHSEYYTVLHGRSEREIMLATEEIRKRHRLHSARRLNFNAKDTCSISRIGRGAGSAFGATGLRPRERRGEIGRSAPAEALRTRQTTQPLNLRMQFPRPMLSRFMESSDGCRGGDRPRRAVSGIVRGEATAISQSDDCPSTSAGSQRATDHRDIGFAPELCRFRSWTNRSWEDDPSCKSRERSHGGIGSRTEARQGAHAGRQRGSCGPGYRKLSAGETILRGCWTRCVSL